MVYGFLFGGTGQPPCAYSGFRRTAIGKESKREQPEGGSFEFGVVAVTEIGKERGNNLELKEVKKGTEEANQKNDLFNSWLKMCRHSATVEGFPFIKVFADEQRPESWGADARDLADVITILSSGDKRLALPFYTIEEMFSEWVYNCFLRLYTDFRFRRGDNTLLVHLLKSGTAWLWRRNLRVQNKYGYSVLKIEKERGTLDGKPEKKKYFLMNAKIYAIFCFVTHVILSLNGAKSLVKGLRNQRSSISKEKNALFYARFPKTPNNLKSSISFTRACCHNEQDSVLTASNSFNGFIDCVYLIIALLLVWSQPYPFWSYAKRRLYGRDWCAKG